MDLISLGTTTTRWANVVLRPLICGCSSSPSGTVTSSAGPVRAVSSTTLMTSAMPTGRPTC